MLDINNWSQRFVVYHGENIDQYQINWGGNSDPRPLLKKGEIYRLLRMDVRSQHTRIYLEGFPNQYFNVVWFDEMHKEEEKEIDHIQGYLHHQVGWICPVCNAINVEDLGEIPSFDGEEVSCGMCDTDYILDEFKE